MLTNNARPVYLSPHLDDAVLSCGGLIHQQAQQGLQPLVITAFAGAPELPELSPFAAERHRRWGLAADAVARRRCEDATALSFLGAEYEHWHHLDSIYRQHPENGEFLYTSNAALFGEVHQVEQGMVEGLKRCLEALLPLETTLIYAPLAVGHHVDHQLASQAALCLRRHGFHVRFYEDFPYADVPSRLELALQQWAAQPRALLQRLDSPTVVKKISAIGLYRSQLQVLFGSEDAVGKRVRSYLLTVGGGQGCAERYWEGGAW
jgi:LmbE family N-acetylglucosaminyl deacetylase